MSTFAPAYRPTKGQENFLTREHKRKRKRQGQDDRSESEASSTDHSSDSDIAKPFGVTATAPSVNRTDPYHVAGLSRERSLPRFPFPHAPVKSADSTKLSVQEELAAVKPPLYVPKTETEDQETSLKRRHLDNITVILHQCMLKGDWERASRAWGLLARTEVAGTGIDIRQHGRWGMGAEILMRREKANPSAASKVWTRRRSDDDTSSVHSEAINMDANQTASRFADEGFQLAREYYERLILQYPHTPHAQHSVNAKVFYPALFNVWVYEVQSRYKHKRREDSKARRSSHHSVASDDTNEHDDSPRYFADQDLIAAEIADATPIADRLDELLLSPPYDVSQPLLQLRGMIGLWLSDLYRSLATAQSHSNDQSSSSADGGDRNEYVDRVNLAQNRQKASAERTRAKELFSKLEATAGNGSAGSASNMADLDAMSE